MSSSHGFPYQQGFSQDHNENGYNNTQQPQQLLLQQPSNSEVGHRPYSHEAQINPLSIEPGLRSPPSLDGLTIVSPRAEHDQHPQDYLSSFPPGHDQSNLESPPNSHSSFFQHYSPNSNDDPIIPHRNSIAGTTVATVSGRARRTGSLAILEEGPYFSNTKQFYNIYDMNQTRSFKLRVMARIDRGFFTASNVWTCYRRNYFQVSTAFNIIDFNHNQEYELPCLLEVTDPPLDIDALNADRIQDPTTMAKTLDALNLNEQRLDIEPASVASGRPTHLEVVSGFSISITSRIACTNKKIDLVQHTPKRDKGPQNVPGLRAIHGGGTLTLAGSNPTQSVITFERVQFKTATANNGKRRAAQQFYVLMVDLYAHTESGRTICVASSQSDSLVVRGRSPSHYTDGPTDGISATSPGGRPIVERRHSNVSQHSSHPYYYNSVPHSRSHSISAGAGMSIDMSTVSLSGGPISPLSPGGVSDYSPTVGPNPSFYQYPSAHWPEGSSLSSPASNYDGSTFSSPTTGYPPQHYHSYSDPNSSQEHPNHHHPHVQSYFPARPPSFGPITPRLMGGPHPFDNRLEPPMEHRFESEEGSRVLADGGNEEGTDGYFSTSQDPHLGIKPEPHPLAPPLLIPQDHIHNHSNGFHGLGYDESHHPHDT
ncbi:meiosis-specific transcription factor ndt80 [Podila epicladia]|nr:meiosis-specific transcription factor ndt80 [Podila epicladia]